MFNVAMDKYLKTRALIDWAFAVQVAGERTLAAAGRNYALIFPDIDEKDLEELHRLTRELNTEIRFFIMAAHNYAKAFDRARHHIKLVPPLPYDGQTIAHLRNIKEHWENFEGKIFEDGIAHPKAKSSLRHFLNLFPNSPITPQTYSIGPGSECVIAQSLNVRSACEHAIRLMAELTTQ
jgi:hypothetical protein